MQIAVPEDILWWFWPLAATFLTCLLFLLSPWLRGMPLPWRAATLSAFWLLALVAGFWFRAVLSA